MIVDSLKDLGAFVRENRKAKNLTQDMLAKKIGVGRQWVSSFENGKANPDFNLLIRTLKILDIKLSIQNENPITAPKLKNNINLDDLINNFKEDAND
ncbi:MAG: helix-turn-helix domain-containing protein [Alphaproteobacteria bacterium]